MSISVKCCDCGKALKAPDALAGAKAKCPDCGAVVLVPSTSDGFHDVDGQQAADFDELADDVGPSAAGQSDLKPCPMCGERISATAAKCRFCGEVLSPSQRRRERQRIDSELVNQMTGADIALCALCFPVGCVVGIVAMITGAPLRGLKMIGLAIVTPFVWGAILSLVR